MLQMKKLANW